MGLVLRGRGAALTPARPITPLRKLLWLDCTAGGAVGLAVLALSGWLSDVYGLPRSVLLFTGLANGLYASYSFTLARRDRAPRRLVAALVVANALWVPVCVALAVRFAGEATAFGLAHLIGEGLFVGGLAWQEWRQRAHASA